MKAGRHGAEGVMRAFIYLQVGGRGTGRLGWVCAFETLTPIPQWHISPNKATLSKSFQTVPPTRDHTLKFMSPWNQAFFLTATATFLPCCPRARRTRSVTLSSYQGSLSSMTPSQCHLMLEFEQMSLEIQTFCLRPTWSFVRLPFLSYRTLSLIVNILTPTRSYPTSDFQVKRCFWLWA